MPVEHQEALVTEQAASRKNPHTKETGPAARGCWAQGVRSSILFATRKVKERRAPRQSDRPSEAFTAFPAYDYAYGLYAFLTMYLCDACPTTGCVPPRSTPASNRCNVLIAGPASGEAAACRGRHSIQLGILSRRH